MRMAITERQGDDTSPLVLSIEKTEWDRLPDLGTFVCAIGQDDWQYIGQVSSHQDARHYAIQVFAATNKINDNLKQYSGSTT